MVILHAYSLCPTVLPPLLAFVKLAFVVAGQTHQPLLTNNGNLGWGESLGSGFYSSRRGGGLEVRAFNGWAFIELESSFKPSLFSSSSSSTTPHSQGTYQDFCPSPCCYPGAATYVPVARGLYCSLDEECSDARCFMLPAPSSMLSVEWVLWSVVPSRRCAQDAASLPNNSGQ